MICEKCKHAFEVCMTSEDLSMILRLCYFCAAMRVLVFRRTECPIFEEDNKYKQRKLKEVDETATTQ